MKKQVGKIAISRLFLKDISRTERSELYDVFAVFIPVYIQDNPISDKVLYWGYSTKFDWVNEGEETPTYDVIVTIMQDGSNDITFKRL